MDQTPLGKQIAPLTQYQPDLLFVIPRKLNREKSGVDQLVFYGYDIWNAYELSWLNQKGKPVVRRCRIIYRADSKNIIESKSLKLYLFSFSMTHFSHEQEIINVIKNDLGKALQTNAIKIELFPYEAKIKYKIIKRKYLIDDLDAAISTYKIDPRQLQARQTSRRREYQLYSNLLKTNCPVTGQPDWATVYVQYCSHFCLDKLSFLKYIISYRDHSDYHEACCEQILFDLFQLLSPGQLSVKCYFTRRGGIEINPVRFLSREEEKKLRFDEHFWRQ